ncbi:MAG: clan AA aspartic protease [Pyrinomonadaceae bacterium]|nr:clan AA aspartic protease [Pyrinomonadaceae bacterium]
MGLVYAEIEIGNPREPNLNARTVKSLVDSGALMLCVPEHIKIQLNLEEADKREITTADGKKHLVSYVGPVKVRFENRSCFVGALVFGNEVLLGAVPMEDMDLIISPAKRALTVNPESPNYPHSLVK